MWDFLERETGSFGDFCGNFEGLHGRALTPFFVVGSAGSVF
jgi:hypothetical protein